MRVIHYTMDEFPLLQEIEHSWPAKLESRIKNRIKMLDQILTSLS
jgi:hypothetical protein